MTFSLRSFVHTYLIHFWIVFQLTGRRRRNIASFSIACYHLPNDLRDPIDRHFPYQGHGKGFKSNVKSAPSRAQGKSIWRNSIAGTVNARYSNYHIAGILKEVKVPEPFLGGIVGFSLFPTTGQRNTLPLGKSTKTLINLYLGWIQLS